MTRPTANARRSEVLRSGLYVALQTLRRRPLGRYLRDLQESARLDPEEYDRTHEQRLTAILHYAAKHVPLYRTRQWQKINSTAETTLDDWPVLEKETLSTHFDELLANPRPKRIVTYQTSGSTGNPTRVAMTLAADALGWAHRYLGLLWHGIPIAARTLRLSHDDRPFRDFFLGQKSVPSTQSDEEIDEAYRYLIEKRPTMVAGPPSTLFRLARVFRERGGHGPLAPFARVGGEQLFPFQRAEIESYLAGRAINSYGCTETGAIAGECPAGSLHVYADHLHVEIVENGSPVPAGELGDIVVTPLCNTAMPLIRYRVGDRGRLSPDRCGCGLPQPVLLELQARSADCFSGTDGRMVHGSELVSRLDRLYADASADGVRQVQLRQIDPRNWEVQVELSDQLRAGNSEARARAVREEQLSSIVREVFGSECRLKTRFVGVIPLEKGKFRYYRT